MRVCPQLENVTVSGMISTNDQGKTHLIRLDLTWGLAFLQEGEFGHRHTQGRQLPRRVRGGKYTRLQRDECGDCNRHRRPRRTKEASSSLPRECGPSRALIPELCPPGLQPGLCEVPLLGFSSHRWKWCHARTPFSSQRNKWGRPATPGVSWKTL